MCVCVCVYVHVCVSYTMCVHRPVAGQAVKDIEESEDRGQHVGDDETN